MLRRSWLQKHLTVGQVLILLNCVGCGIMMTDDSKNGFELESASRDPGNHTTRNIRISNALKAAVSELESAELLDDSMQYRLTASRIESGWIFWFELLPLSPDADYTVVVHDNGDVDIGP